MSRRRGTQHRKPRRRIRHDDAMVCTRVAVVHDRTVTADVELAKRITHDRLIVMTGDRRSSGVRWALIDNDNPRIWEVLDGLDGPGPSRTELDPLNPADLPDNVETDRLADYSGVRERVAAHPEGVLVIAMCDTTLRARDLRA